MTFPFEEEVAPPPPPPLTWTFATLTAKAFSLLIEKREGVGETTVLMFLCELILDDEDDNGIKGGCIKLCLASSNTTLL